MVNSSISTLTARGHIIHNPEWFAINTVQFTQGRARSTTTHAQLENSPRGLQCDSWREKVP